MGTGESPHYIVKNPLTMLQYERLPLSVICYHAWYSIDISHTKSYREMWLSAEILIQESLDLVYNRINDIFKNIIMHVFGACHYCLCYCVKSSFRKLCEVIHFIYTL